MVTPPPTPRGKRWNAAWRQWQRIADAIEAMDDELLMMMAAHVEGVVQDRNNADRRSVWRGPWNPWRALRRQWDRVELHWFELPDELPKESLRGLVEQRPAPLVRYRYRISLNTRLQRDERWLTLSHELTHIRRGLDRVGTGDIFAGPDTQRDTEERAVEAAARRLMMRAELPPRSSRRSTRHSS